MKRLALLMMVLICSSAIIAAESDQPRPPQKQMQKIRNAQKELEQQRDELNRERKELEHQREQMRHNMQRPPRKHMQKGGHKPICGLLMVMCGVVNILVAVWVFQDIRTRGTGSGIWIVIALLAGLLGALVYAVVRLGDIKKS